MSLAALHSGESMKELDPVQRAIFLQIVCALEEHGATSVRDLRSILACEIDFGGLPCHGLLIETALLGGLRVSKDATLRPVRSTFELEWGDAYIALP